MKVKIGIKSEERPGGNTGSSFLYFRGRDINNLITDYAEDNTYTDTVYGYVPVEIVDKLIEKHGGIVDL